MSTSKTQNYDLHAWEPDDDFQLHEINENFAAIDSALGVRYPVVIGTYVGDGTQARLIDLGAAAAAVLVENNEGTRSDYDHSFVFGGLALPGAPMSNNGLVVQGAGFLVSYQSSIRLQTNQTGILYRYVAWLEP